ncbi:MULTISPECIES: hypothetical protein [unclassified Actinokineospora]|uniref:hypothetical protein n=1 Tax=Actinokineospora sp. UTMC 2448 TaxID=2268449 RepID=UPI0021645822|nr:hypothetical protein [Actinokineospora sp. UTMC 2448]UVS79456.1 hypothetical protein Actkin_03204 [Actinokineospora sp. UTMC 2448]
MTIDPKPQHVLLTEARFGDAGPVAARLRAAGARVSTCHADAGLCRALAPGSRCPLDTRTDPVDLFVDVRGADDELTTREYGVVCALRANRPVFVVEADPLVAATAPVGLAARVTVTSVDRLADALAAR